MTWMMVDGVMHAMVWVDARLTGARGSWRTRCGLTGEVPTRRPAPGGVDYCAACVDGKEAV